METVAGKSLLALFHALRSARLPRKSTLPIHTFDITVYGISALILSVVSLCAMSLPARKAKQVHPMQALRSE